MNIVNVVPDKEHPIPESLKDEVGDTFQEDVNIAANTAVLLDGLGMPFELSEEDAMRAKELFEDVENRKRTPRATKELRKELTQPGVVMALGEYIGEYGKVVVANAVETRNLIQNRLLQISQCGDTKHELKALELLGKMSDVGAFTEKSELVITHKSSDELHAAIKEKINRLLHSDIIDVEPLSDGLEEELGLLEEVPTEQQEDPDETEKLNKQNPQDDSDEPAAK